MRGFETALSGPLFGLQWTFLDTRSFMLNTRAIYKGTLGRRGLRQYVAWQLPRS
jgi:hypothetical protein